MEFAIAPPRLLQEDVAALGERVRARQAQGVAGAWGEVFRWLVPQLQMWKDTGLVVRVLEAQLEGFFHPSFVDPRREEVRAFLAQVVEALRRGERKPLPTLGQLPAEFRAPGGGWTVSPDALPRLLAFLGPQAVVPECRLWDAALPLASAPGAKAYAAVQCPEAEAIDLLVGKAYASTRAEAAGKGKPHLERAENSGFATAQSFSRAFGERACLSRA